MVTLKEALRDAPDPESTRDLVKSVGKRFEGLVSFTPEQSVLIHRFGMLSKEVFTPKAIEYDRNPKPQIENFEVLQKEGLMGLVVPKEFGGHGADYKTFAFCVAQTACGDRSTALILMMNYVTNYIFDNIGTDEQRKRFAQEVTKLSYLTATATSEGPSLNAKKVTLDTKFVPTEDASYKVTGLKRFLSGARISNRVSLIGEGPEGFMLAVIYPHDTNINPGTIEIKENESWDPRGMRGTMSETVVFDVKVSQKNIIGKPGEVFQSGLFRLFALGQAAVALGSAMKTRELFADHIQNVERAGLPVRSPEEYDGLTGKLGEINERISPMISSLASAADAFINSNNPNNAENNPNDLTKAVYETKLICASTAKEISEITLEAGGGNAYARRGIFNEIDLINRDLEGICIMPPNIQRTRTVIDLIDQQKTAVKPLGFERSQTTQQRYLT